MSQVQPTLHLLCGKVASGKSSLAAKLANSGGAVLISEDEWLSVLFGDQMNSLQDYVNCALKLRPVMGRHIASLLKAGVSVILDFPANTIENRAWMRKLLEETAATHQLHFLDLPDEVCLRRLHKRNSEGAHAFAATEDQYWRLARYFEAPSPEEGFNVITHNQ